MVIPEFSSGVNFTDPIILERADNISLAKTVNSDIESISFTVPLTDPKVVYINYLRWWECWDTETNIRLNYGPIREIAGTGGEPKRVSGPGRSAVLSEFYKSIQTFYYPVNLFFDDLRYENIAGEPRTSTIINQATSSDYYGLSLRSKDYVIDEQTGYISIGRDTPVQGPIKTDVFWSGVAKADWLTVNLGDQYTISKARVLLPWWGGATINTNRTYDWSFSYSTNNDSFTEVYSTPVPNQAFTGWASEGGLAIYMDSDFGGFERYTVSGSTSPIEAQYWKLNITNTHAWYGNRFEGSLADEWNWECGESDVLYGEPRESPTISGGIIPKDDINPSSDCHASAVEIGLYRKILPLDNIPNLVYHQIQNTNRQITYYHVPDSSEMITVGGGNKYEPGSFFRNIQFTGGGTVKDEYNAVLYEGSGTTLKCPAYTRMLLFSSPAYILNVDTWIGKTDAFSYGGSYSYSTVANDYATLHFRGVSLKWFATIPEGETAGQVTIELRSQGTDGTWSAWTEVDESPLTLPTGVSAEKVFEITYESGILQDETIYELKITNINGGYVSIDAFAGYWSGSFTEYNQDDYRLHLRIPEEATQIYDGKFSFGSVIKFVGGVLTKGGLSFTGDRVVVYGRKGPDYGIIRIALWSQAEPEISLVNIPGTGNGYLEVDLNHPYDIAQVVLFDSDEYFIPNVGLPWGKYLVAIYKPEDPDPIWIDGIGVHETSGLSVKFLNTSHLEILKSTAEALQLEWDITENGLLITPRLGTDTEVIFAEGRGTTINIENVEDVSQIATMLVATGADIDGLPLSAVVENKKTRELFGRTVQKLYDFRNIGDYFTLIGAARTELLRRREPQRRIVVRYAVGPLPIVVGDSFIIKKSDFQARVRAITITRSQNSSTGTEYVVECLEWPQIN